MARKKLTEFAAKKIFFDSLDMLYQGISILSENDIPEKINHLRKTENYVVKVDQGIKKRAKQGLIAIKVSPHKVKTSIEQFVAKGYSQFLVEPFVPHEETEEKYFSIERLREGVVVRYSHKGGVDIEEHVDLVESKIIVDIRDQVRDIKEISHKLSVPPAFIEQILSFFDKQYISFLEINPLVVHNSEIFILDLAVEVDSAGEFFVKNGWNQNDFVEDGLSRKTQEELAVMQLKENSQASLKLDVLNQNGSLFTLLSGGGASITLADEIYNRGYGKELANYADYSGNPNQEETYLYTKQLLILLRKSEAHKKALIIAGGVANFTDIRTTFRGILQALQENVADLRKQKVKVFVRRPGPNQKVGLQMMSDFLKRNDLYGGVWDQDLILTDVILKALNFIQLK